MGYMNGWVDVHGAGAQRSDPKAGDPTDYPTGHGPQGDAMLSRDINELNNNISADYFLTGTYTTQENSTIVNIRLIQVPENIVLAAATDYVPNDTMWSKSKISLKNNQIYRNEY